jgi:hypothetical protein
MGKLAVLPYGGKISEMDSLGKIDLLFSPA